MDSAWYPDQNRPLFRAEPVILTAFVVEITTILIPSKPLRILLGMPIFLLCAIHIRTHTAGTVSDDYLMAINILWIMLRWFDLAVLNEPETSFRRDDTPRSAKKQNGMFQTSLLKRFMWSTSLCSTYRGIGWNWRVKNVDYVSPAMSRSKYVVTQILKCIRAYVVSDFVYYYTNHVQFPNPGFPDITTLELPNRLGMAWAFAIRGVCDLQLLYYLTSAFLVLLGLAKPEDWPPMFGLWQDLYTVRKAWGYCWHQLLRRLFESYTNAAANLLGSPGGAFVTRYFKLYGAFLLSAAIHQYGCLNVPWTPRTKYHALFFIVQPFVITFEDLMIYLGKHMGMRWNVYVRLLGYAWVFVAFSLTLQLMAISYYAWAEVDDGWPMKHPLLVWSIADHVLG